MVAVVFTMSARPQPFWLGSAISPSKKAEPSLKKLREVRTGLFEMKICSWLYSSPVLLPSRPCSRPSFEKYPKPSLQRTICSSLHPKHFQMEKVYQKHSRIGDQHQIFIFIWLQNNKKSYSTLWPIIL